MDVQTFRTDWLVRGASLVLFAVGILAVKADNLSGLARVIAAIGAVAAPFLLWYLIDMRVIVSEGTVTVHRFGIEKTFEATGTKVRRMAGASGPLWTFHVIQLTGADGRKAVIPLVAFMSRETELEDAVREALR